MPQITIEYMIMIPILILQIFLFPLTAGWIMDSWENSRQTLALKETTSHLSSSIQQIYSALTHSSMSSTTITINPEVPFFIEGKTYTANATLSGFSPNSTRMLEVNLYVTGSEIEATKVFPVGEDFLWQDSSFISNDPAHSIIASKHTNGTIFLSFGGA
jgi:hypothetical protein